MLAAIGALVAVLQDCTIQVEREKKDEVRDGRSEAAHEPITNALPLFGGRLVGLDGDPQLAGGVAPDREAVASGRAWRDHREHDVLRVHANVRKRSRLSVHDVVHASHVVLRSG